jgi:hypothetical protein
MLKRGVEKVRDSLVTFSTQLNPNIDTTELEEDDVIFPTRWKSYSVAVKNGADVTAWNRYKAWHEAVIAGDPKLNPTSTMTSSAAELDVGVRNHNSVGVKRPYLHELSIDHLHYGVALTLPCIARQRRTLSRAYTLPVPALSARSRALSPIIQED